MGHTYLATFACVCAWHSSWYLATCSGMALPMASLSFWSGSFRRPPCKERTKSRFDSCATLTLRTHKRLSKGDRRCSIYDPCADAATHLFIEVKFPSTLDQSILATGQEWSQISKHPRTDLASQLPGLHLYAEEHNTVINGMQLDASFIFLRLQSREER